MDDTDAISLNNNEDEEIDEILNYIESDNENNEFIDDKKQFNFKLFDLDCKIPIYNDVNV